jgi:hypothetical protein
MYFARLAPAAFILLFSGSAFAQGWFEYTNREEFFQINLPGEPRIEQFTYISEYGSRLPAKRFTAQSGPENYTVTVVNMATTDRPPGYSHGNELRGAIAFAATQVRKTGTVTLDAYTEIDVIPGMALQVTLPNGRRNFVAIHQHGRRLYIAEAEVPGGPDQAPPTQFQASLAILDANGNTLRYRDDNYSFPDGRPIARRGNQAIPPPGQPGAQIGESFPRRQ